MEPEQTWNLYRQTEKTTGRLPGQFFPQTPAKAFCHF
jgi:hypothetical protein